MEGKSKKAEGKSEDWSQRGLRAPSRIGATLPSVLTFAFCLFTFAFLAPSAQAAWRKQQTGTFAWLHSVFFVDESRGWAVGGKGALLYTSDGGAHWELRPRFMEDAMQDVFFTDARTGWIVCERSIFATGEGESVSYLLKTTDGGETWTRVEVTRGEYSDVKLAGLRFADATHGWVYGEAGALYATTDGGETWSRQPVPTRHLLLGASFTDARTGWLSGGGLTLLLTTDGGATWHAGTVYAPVQPAPLSSQRLNAISFADAETGWAVGAGGAIFSTRDGGRTWKPQASGTGSDLRDVKFLDRAEGWAVGGEGTVLHTTDGGQTWKAEARATDHSLERLFFAGRKRAWAVGFGGTVVAFKD
jgi:photosystem II stability/assembly factor-like uncharacterized protein